MPLSKIAAVAVAGALAVGPAPAVAAPPCATPMEYAAGAGADLVRLGLLDLRPLGLPLGPVADVRVASTRSGMAATAPVNSAAAARYLDAKVLGVPLPAGPLSTSAYQEAPPRNAEPVTAHAVQQDLGVVLVGTGDLTAYATWHAGMACGARTGDATRSSATIAGAAVLPGPGGTALVRVPAGLRTRTATGLREDGGVVRSVATASAGLADIRVFAGTPAEIAVKVVRSPRLTVGTGGTAATTTVEYAAPVLEISGPGIGTHRLDTPGGTVDVPLAGLLDAVGALKPERLRGATATEDAGPLHLPGLSTATNPLTSGLPVVGGGRSLLRVTVSDVDSEVTDRSVRAEAAMLRLQVVTRPTDEGEKGVADLAIGMLDAAALAPRPLNRPDLPTPPGGAGGLPVTGTDVGLVAALGVLLLVTGVSIALATRSRRPSVRSIHDRPYG